MTDVEVSRILTCIKMKDDSLLSKMTLVTRARRCANHRLFMLLINLKKTLSLQLFVATMNSSYNTTAEYVFVLTLSTYLVLVCAKQVRILDLATHIQT